LHSAPPVWEFPLIDGGMLPSSVLGSIAAARLGAYDLPGSSIRDDGSNEEEIRRAPPICVWIFTEGAKRFGDWTWRDPRRPWDRFRGRKKDFLRHTGRQNLWGSANLHRFHQPVLL